MSKMGKWYNKIFIGDPNKEDYSAKDLPKTRLDQFWDVLRLRFSGLLTGNLLYTLFALPLVLFATYYWFAIGQMDADKLNENLFSENSTVLSFLLICIPLYTLMGPAKAGLHYCLRNWCWNERATIREHFWKEFKRSWKQACLLNFINALALYATAFWVLFLILNQDKYPVFRFLAIAIVVLASFYFMTTIYHFPQLVTYNLKLKQIYKNAVIYTVAQMPRTLLAVAIYLVLAALCFFLSQVFVVVFLTLGMSVVFLGQTVYSQFLFDKYVNPDDKKRKGMAPLE